MKTKKHEITFVRVNGGVPAGAVPRLSGSWVWSGGGGKRGRDFKKLERHHQDQIVLFPREMSAFIQSECLAELRNSVLYRNYRT